MTSQPLSLTHLSLAQYQLTLEALEPLKLPPYKGSALRGGFGHVFKRLVCFQRSRCQAQCSLGNTCPYGYVFETAPPTEAKVLRNIQAVARPFIIEPPPDQRTHFQPGERLTFGLTLIGRGINYLPYFVITFRELGEVGLGAGRGRYQLRSMDACLPYQKRRLPIYRSDDDMVRVAEAAITGEAISDYAATLPTDRLTLTFLTPTQLKHQNQRITTGPPFAVLVKALLNRLSMISYFHCDQTLETDFRGLIARAEGVQIVDCQTQQVSRKRFSSRQQQKIFMGGLIGQVTYEGPLQEFLPLLAAGELLHVGRGTVFGNGQYQLG